MTYFAYFYLFNENFCYFRGFRAAISFFSTDLHVKLKALDKYLAILFRTQKLFPTFLG